MAVKNSLEIIIKQVHLEGGFKRGSRIRVAECLRRIVPNRWASVRKRSLYNAGGPDSPAPERTFSDTTSVIGCATVCCGGRGENI